MNKKLSGILGIILSILIIVYFETFFYKLLNIIGINVNNFSSINLSIISLIIKLIICFLIYLIYKKDFRKRRNTNSIIKMIFILIVCVIAITFITYLFNYIIEYLAKIFKVKIITNEFYNIFDKKINFDLIIKIINDYAVIPYIYVSTIILSIDKISKRNDTFILLSALLASIVYALTLEGTLIFVIVNSLNTFVIFGLLSFIYKKFNSIWLVIFIYSLYLISNVLILNCINL